MTQRKFIGLYGVPYAPPNSLEECFLPWEAEMVARIPLYDDWDKDILIWPLTLDGEYSVHSAYRMLVAVECRLFGRLFGK